MRAGTPVRYPSPLLLFLLCCALGGVVFLELRLDWSIANAPARAASGDFAIALPGSPSDFVMPARARYTEIVDRPLFSRTRRPPSAPAPIPTPPVAEPERSATQFFLTGVITGPDEKIALVRPRGRSETLRVLEGQTVAGWYFETIQVDRVLVRFAGALQQVLVNTGSQ